MFSTDLFKHLLSLQGVVSITFDQCEFGLHLPEDVVNVDVDAVVNMNVVNGSGGGQRRLD